MSSAHYHVHSSAPAGSKVRAEPKVLDSRLGKHAFLPSRSVSQPAGQSARYQTARWAGDHDLRRPETRQTDNWAVLVLAAYRRRKVTSPAC